MKGRAILPEQIGESVLQRVREVIARQPVRYRHFLELDLLERLSQERICAELQILPATYKSLKYMALKSLLRALRESL